MTLNAIKTTSGYIVEGLDAVGKPVEIFFTAEESRNYDHLAEVEQTFHKKALFEHHRANLPDPERDLYVQIFGAGDEPTDSALHTTLTEAQEARNGIALDWTKDSVTTALRLIHVGQSHRLRLIDGMLVDMGAGYDPAPPAPSGYVNGPSGPSTPVAHGEGIRIGG